MANPDETMLQVVQLMLAQHPHLARAVEELALISQGRDQTSLQLQRHVQREAQMFAGLDSKAIFTKIYIERLWGHPGDPEQIFWSGPGSHADPIVRPYLQSVRRFLESLQPKPDVVDLGCGDFAVGQQLRPFCGRYIACDIVDPLIHYNQRRFAALEVDFRVLDMARDPIPPGDVVFIRQVLQHLSNAEIEPVVRQIERGFKHLVLTEHVPLGTAFTPNLDKPTGRDVRIHRGSGIVLTAAPFHLQAKAEQVLCEAPEAGGVNRTTLYTLA